MPRRATPQYVINSYQKKSKFLPILIWVIAALIFGSGILILVLWFTGDGGGSFNLFASDTPTPTETFTPSPTVPTATPTMTATATETPTPTYTPTPEGPQAYTVEEGDNCWTIAVDKFGVNFEIFMAINNMVECNINIGDTVIIPAPDQEMPTATPIPLDQYTTGQQIEYTVQMNDDYTTLASKFNTTLESIAKLNDIEDPVYTFPQFGTKLIIAVNLVTPTPSPVPTYTEVPTGN